MLEIWYIKNIPLFLKSLNKMCIYWHSLDRELFKIKKWVGYKDISTTQRFYLRFGNLDQVDVRKQLEGLTGMSPIN